MSDEDLDEAEESGNGPSEMLGCGVIACFLVVMCGIAWAAVHGIAWKAVLP